MIQENAVQLNSQGYNCAQAVLVACESYTHLDQKTALAIAGGFGGGLRCGEVCGAVSGALMAISLCYPYNDCNNLEAKKKIAALAVELTGAFKEKFGMLRCEDLKNVNYSCKECIKYAAALAEEIINNNQ